MENKRMLERFLAWSAKIFRKPWLVVALAAAVTVLFGFGIPRLKFDNNIKTMLPRTNKALAVHDYYEDENRFGASDMIFVGVASDDAYSARALEYLRTINAGIDGINRELPGRNVAALLGLKAEEGAAVVEALRGVGINELNYRETLAPLIVASEQLVAAFAWEKSFADKVAKAASGVDPRRLYNAYETPINKTQSLVNADYLAYEDDSLVTKKLVDEGAPIGPETGAELKRRVGSWEMYKDALVSDDGKLATVLVSLNTHDIDVKGSLNKAIADMLKSKADPAFKTYLDGEPVIEEMIARFMVQDIKLLIPLVVLVVLLILYLCFRNVQGVAYTAAIILMSVVAAVGTMGYLGIPVTVVGTAMPVLLVAIVSAYGIHQMNHYLVDPRAEKLEILDSNMKNVGLAITLSGLTVMVGFGSLASSAFVPVKNFGVFTAWGDLVGVVAALYVLPALILASRKPKTAFCEEDCDGGAASKGWVSRILGAFVRLNKTASPAVLIASALIAAGSFYGLFLVKTELNNVALFKKTEAVRVSDDVLNDKLAGTQVLNIVLDTDLSDPVGRGDAAEGETVDITTPAVLNKVESFSADVRKEFPFVKKVLSFNTILKKMNQEMNGGAPELYAVPQDKNLISQYLLIFTGDAKSVLSPNHDKLRISLNMKRSSGDDLERVRKYAVAYFGEDFLKANHLQAQVTGASHLYYVANTLLVDGTFRSIYICIAVVLILLLFVLKDLWMSLIALVPIFITLLIDFGVLGYFNIPLNAGTAMVSTVAIGIGVDYSIHFITWFRGELRKDGNIALALERSIMHKGRAILYNMFVIVGGFLVMTVSRFIPLIQFGILTSICMVTTAVGALVVVPAIIRLLAKRDYDFLYLGSRKGAAAAE
jgi:predicted RND superfamily exporter protein